jgi:hypothetical protein
MARMMRVVASSMSSAMTIATSVSSMRSSSTRSISGRGRSCAAIPTWKTGSCA